MERRARPPFPRCCKESSPMWFGWLSEQSTQPMYFGASEVTGVI